MAGLVCGWSQHGGGCEDHSPRRHKDTRLLGVLDLTVMGAAADCNSTAPLPIRARLQDVRSLRYARRSFYNAACTWAPDGVTLSCDMSAAASQALPGTPCTGYVCRGSYTFSGPATAQ